MIERDGRVSFSHKDESSYDYLPVNEIKRLLE